MSCSGDSNSGGSNNTGGDNPPSDPGQHQREWSAPTTLDATSDNVGGANLAMSANGTAIVLWHRFMASSDTSWATHYAPDTGWEKPEKLGASNIDNQSLAMDAQGNAFAVWAQKQTNGSGDQDILVSRYGF